MRKYILVIFGIIFTLIYLLSQPSLAFEAEKCKDCHGIVKPIPRESITKDCSRCHGMHSSDPVPKTRDPDQVHGFHKDAGKTVRQQNCMTCHQSPIECTKCHNSHDIESIKRAIIPKIAKNVTDIGNRTNISSISRQNISEQNISEQNISIKIPSCTDCHGNLPQPKGHGEFRDALSFSKHWWMKCNSCHLNPYSLGESYKFELRFKDLLTIPIDDSIKLCKICHSSQYERMTEGTHGTLNKTCVNCHNPHTTQLTGPKFQITPKPTPVNMSVRTSEGKKWLFEKIPILNNPTLMIIIFILILVFVGEYVLSRHEEGKKVAYDTVKFQAGEETLKTLEVKLKSQDINLVNDTLRKHGNILGMTMAKEEDKEDPSLSIYKYVIFVDLGSPIDETGENDLISEILSLDNVKSAQITDKYEL